MKTPIIFTISLLICLITLAQTNIDQIIKEIEKNNTTLQANQLQMEAEMISNKTGIYLANPEFEYAWHAGNPSNIGSKTNISLRQHFHFPTAYIQKSRIANSRNDQLKFVFAQKRGDLLLEARLLCLVLIHSNAMMQELEFRLSHAQRMANAYETMLEAGEVNILELNKAKLNLLNIQKEMESMSIQQSALQDNLTTLNGGIPISLNDTSFPVMVMDEDFEQWIQTASQKNPFLQWLKQETELSRKQESLQRALNLPSFSAGYVSETLTHEEFQGFAVGISIPMWENKNTLKFARAQTHALQSAEDDNAFKYQNFLKTQHTKLMSLAATSQEYRSILTTLDNKDLLLLALEQGELSLTQYLLELSFLYQSTDNILEMELELHKTRAILYQYLDN